MVRARTSVSEIAKTRTAQIRGADGRFPAVDFLGNISLRLVGLLCTLAVLGAVYFLFVKPAMDTTNKAFNSVGFGGNNGAGIEKQVEKTLKAARHQMNQSFQQGNTASGQATQVNITKIQNCVNRAHGNVNKLQRCARLAQP
jgi:hypothetical protein